MTEQPISGNGEAADGDDTPPTGDATNVEAFLDPRQAAMFNRFKEATKDISPRPFPDNLASAWEGIPQDHLITLRLPKSAFPMLFSTLRQIAMLSATATTVGSFLSGGKRTEAENALIDLLSRVTSLQTNITEIENVVKGFAAVEALDEQ